MNDYLIVVLYILQNIGVCALFWIIGTYIGRYLASWRNYVEDMKELRRLEADFCARNDAWARMMQPTKKELK